MVSWKKRIRRTHILAAVVPVLVILIPLGYSLVGFVFGQGEPAGRPFIERADAKYESCVRDTEYMRIHHWELLKELRIGAVRDGVRSEITLDTCRQCHPNRARFCNRCHDAVSLHPDCFDCHYYPETAAAEPAGHAGGGE